MCIRNPMLTAYSDQSTFEIETEDVRPEPMAAGQFFCALAGRGKCAPRVREVCAPRFWAPFAALRPLSVSAPACDG